MINQSSQETISALTQTISVSDLTLADWISIANAAEVNNARKWAYHRWAGSTSENLQDLKIEDWESIGKETEHADGWAYHKYREYKKA